MFSVQEIRPQTVDLCQQPPRAARSDTAPTPFHSTTLGDHWYDMTILAESHSGSTPCLTFPTRSTMDLSIVVYPGSVPL